MTWSFLLPAVDFAALGERLRSSMTTVICEQAGAGIDTVSDGDLGKIGFGLPYWGRRLTGLTSRKVRTILGWMALGTCERIEFADSTRNSTGPPRPRVSSAPAPITYIGSEEVKKDTALLKAALAEASVKVDETSMSCSRSKPARIR